MRKGALTITRKQNIGLVKVANIFQQNACNQSFLSNIFLVIFDHCGIITALLGVARYCAIGDLVASENTP
jgi:hypothetical protein